MECWSCRRMIISHFSMDHSIIKTVEDLTRAGQNVCAGRSRIHHVNGDVALFIIISFSLLSLVEEPNGHWTWPPSASNWILREFFNYLPIMTNLFIAIVYLLVISKCFQYDDLWFSKSLKTNQHDHYKHQHHHHLHSKTSQATIRPWDEKEMM